MDYKLTPKQAEELILTKLSHNFGVSQKDATDEHYYKAVVLVVRDLLTAGYTEFSRKAVEQKKKTVYYLCMEFLMGRSLKNNLSNLGLEGTMNTALKNLGVKLDNVYEQEPDAGLGNGGLGRLAACFLDALASQAYPSMGYSLRYEYGIFSQKLIDGWQTEMPDFWLPGGSVWLQDHPEKAITIKFNGRVVEEWKDGLHKVDVVDSYNVVAIPYDMMVAGNDGKGVSRLRLWAAKSNSFDMQLFNDGDYLRAIEQNAMAESITKVLYPGDNHPEGKSLRLNQQYFLVSATIQDIINRHLRNYNTLDNLPELVTIHLNDTHPVLAVPELMRIIMDDCGYGWDQAWDIVNRTIAYTNHTVMKEALECWEEQMFKTKLPRIYEILAEINRRFYNEMRSRGVDGNKIDRMAIINDGVVKMANLAVIAGYKVNGVSALHSEILKDTVFHDFYTVYPNKFTNVTNGVAHRRWLNQSNPQLADLLNELIGTDYIDNASQLSKLMAYKDDKSVLDRLERIKRANKLKMVDYIKKHNGVTVDPDSIFDVQVKRLHEYKRQLMNALHILTTYRWLRENPNANFTPKTYIFGAKAAPGYYFAKQIIQFIIALSNKIEKDDRVNKKLKVVYLEDYRVTLAEKLIPASEISEQISLAGTEASGTSNMKFMLNGAITMGTLDGANVEINQAVGNENMFLFGLKTPEVENIKRSGYNPMVYYQNNHILRGAVDEINDTRFGTIANSLMNVDPYMVLADFADYSAAQQRASALYVENKEQWNRMSLINIANAGIFAADRSIRDYADGIWNLSPVDLDK
ncbi:MULTISPECIES: glycogen/starch/alpha-glucan phosphorylase [unclassified Ruminococcus]|uniref:glycogen/starch/alpha-glucan phosphorylase n=1 Tax=unclassified Ruminococcus TaxID=2608920 RepID=UPI00210E9526|nr:MULTISPECIES: glycogen/starch/alpha-glucan phosphorylase [unclassified Ruminococcus]MCQ4021460.1 glycogen/starch/alpha-glucan family phosphorylase [Ruminococcus sp. zg-924]MCQ4113905.1 glycogen/starch/alpha-glucan family phosphorylase [Ruminococcus sp. zg-921]